MMQSAAAVPLAAQVGVAAKPTNSVYARLGIRPVINAYGTVTTLGGTLLLPEVRQWRAAGIFVKMDENEAEKVPARLQRRKGSGRNYNRNQKQLCSQLRCRPTTRR
jgi:seryl-tRNA(Sec) selenium transferase